LGTFHNSFIYFEEKHQMKVQRQELKQRDKKLYEIVSVSNFTIQWISTFLLFSNFFLVFLCFSVLKQLEFFFLYLGLILNVWLKNFEFVDLKSWTLIIKDYLFIIYTILDFVLINDVEFHLYLANILDFHDWLNN
jgi:hypothetical protein